jgi:hypothetical protein
MQKNKLIVISGCPRSGTSLMMDCLRNCLDDGNERLIGFKFPQLESRKKVEVKTKFESDKEFELRQWADKVHNPNKTECIKKALSMNPNGFWEHTEFSVKGLNYNMFTSEIIKGFQKSEKRKFAKIVSNGLLNTCPEYIDRVIFMVRNPIDVAKSQENLERNMKFKLSNGREIDLLEGVKINSPEMFINVTIAACKWIVDNPDIPIKIIEYENLISNPSLEIHTVIDFLGEGNIEKHSVNPSIDRSVGNTDNTEIWNEAIEIHKLFLNMEFQKIWDLQNEKQSKKIKQWLCLRAGMQCNENICDECKSNQKFREQIRQQATQRKVDWLNAPCVYEVAYAENQITIEQSIQKNFWKLSKIIGSQSKQIIKGNVQSKEILRPLKLVK